jgi:hypothetical protein
MECPLCNSKVEKNYTSSREYITNCPTCGQYMTTSQEEFLIKQLFEMDKELIGKQYLFSSYLAEQNERGNTFIELTSDKIKTIYSSGTIPTSIHDRIDRILERIFLRSTYFNQLFRYDYFDYNKQYAQNTQEYESMLSVLFKKEYLGKGQIASQAYITLNGIDYLESRNISINSNQCFVAMWFNVEMLELFKNTIKPLVDSLGYNTIIIPMVEHNGSINDHIIAEIKKSKFIIADFSGNRGGVYFEAGFALGLGKQVIWTCKKDYFNTEIKKLIRGKIEGDIEKEVEIIEKSEIHFDINHYNFIVWETIEELCEKLKNRIEATINI